MNSKIRQNEIKLSIVMPVYQTEQYVDRCIESVLKQSYKNIELIVVDDGSGGDIKERIKAYRKQDSRIRFLSNQQNRGLFQARLAGAQRAKGQYLAFIDSDDYVTRDYYHVLLEAALEEDADIAVGKTVFEDPDGSRYIRNFHDACFYFHKIEGEEVKKRYFGQQGRCFSWHTIWNKLYKKELWDRCMPYYAGVHGHVVMTEDIAFSSVLFYFASSLDPGVYLKAFLALTDGYYDLCYEEAILDLYPKLPVDAQLTGVSTPKWAEAFALKEDAFWTFLTGIPLLGCLFRTAVFSWVMFFTLFYAAYRKKGGWMLYGAGVFELCGHSALPMEWGNPVWTAFDLHRTDRNMYFRKESVCAGRKRRLSG